MTAETLSQIMTNESYAVACDQILAVCFDDQEVTMPNPLSADMRYLIGFVLQGGRLTQKLLHDDPMQAMRFRSAAVHGYTNALVFFHNATAFKSDEEVKSLRDATEEVKCFLYPDTRLYE